MTRVNKNLISSEHTATAYTQSGDPIVDQHLSGIDDELGTMQTAASALAAKVPLNKFDATSDPTINEDDGDGYAVGSQWHNTSNSTVWFCLDASTGAAVWEDVTSDGTPSILVIDFTNSDPDWTGSGPYTLTKSHGFGTTELYIMFYDTNDRPLPLFVSGSQFIEVTTTNITLSNTSSAISGKLILTDASGGFRSSRTPTVLLNELLTVDGAGSGLDADTVDGQHASEFAASSHTHSIANVTGLQTALDAKAPLSSPGLTGTPTAPTVSSAADSTTKLATTAFVHKALTAAGVATWDISDTHMIFVSEDGDDSGGNGSPDLPFATVTAALANLTSDVDTIVVSGTVTETATLDLSSTSDITILGLGRGQSVITNSTVSTTIDAYGTSDYANVLIKDITIINDDDDTNSAVISIGAGDGITTSIRFEDVEFISRGRPVAIASHVNGSVTTNMKDCVVGWGAPPTTPPSIYVGIYMNSHAGTGATNIDGITFTSIGPQASNTADLVGVSAPTTPLADVTISNLHGEFTANTTGTAYLIFTSSAVRTTFGLIVKDSSVVFNAPGIGAGASAYGLLKCQVIDSRIIVTRNANTGPLSSAVYSPREGSNNFHAKLINTATGVATCKDIAVYVTDGTSNYATLGSFTAELECVPSSGDTYTFASGSGALNISVAAQLNLGDVSASLMIVDPGSSTTMANAQAVYIAVTASDLVRIRKLAARIYGSTNAAFSSGTTGIRYEGSASGNFVIEDSATVTAVSGNAAPATVISSSYAVAREAGAGTLTINRHIDSIQYAGFANAATAGISTTSYGGTI